jgi:hypothetical protein
VPTPSVSKMAARLGCHIHGHVGTFQREEEILLTDTKRRVINHYQCINCGTWKQFLEETKKVEMTNVAL